MGNKFDSDKIKTYQIAENSEQLSVNFTDNVVDEAGEIIKAIPGKGKVNCMISTFLFRYLENYHIPTAFIKATSDSRQLLKNVDEIPFTVVVRNVMGGKIREKLQLDDTKHLRSQILEYYVKDSENQDLMINRWHVLALGLVSAEEMKLIERQSSKINAVLKSLFARRHLQLLDFSFKFGRFQENLYLADGFVFDSMRVLDLNTDINYDAAVFAGDSSKAIEYCEALIGRLMSSAE
ncbi:hypothetical protein JXJ21_14665 [candidate division KSB1 bacterium]|nr:hypothetical protein [candidate division KSB1 bacterium]